MYNQYNNDVNINYVQYARHYALYALSHLKLSKKKPCGSIVPILHMRNLRLKRLNIGLAQSPYGFFH